MSQSQIFSKDNCQFSGNYHLWYAYSDTIKGGKSENYNIEFSDTCVQWSFRLSGKANLNWPFCGLSRSLCDWKKHCFGIEDTLIAELYSNQSLQVTFKLISFDEQITRPEDPVSYRVLECPATLSPGKQTIKLPVKKFKVAQWWKKKYKIPAEDNRFFLDSLCKIDLRVNGYKYSEINGTVRLYNYEIQAGKRISLFLYLFLTGITIICVILVYWFFLQIRTGKKHDKGQFIFLPRQISSGPSDWERIIEYMQKNYSDPSLRVHKVAHELGYSENKVTNLVNEKYSYGFRGLINELRIEEGMRLLKESTMNISEIAYKLGYATPNHFNREFKKRAKVTPGIFRKSFS